MSNFLWSSDIKRFFFNEQDPVEAQKQIASKKAMAEGEADANDVDVPIDAPVAAPAFSLTKVLTAGSVVITVAATVVSKTLTDDEFKLAPFHVVLLALGLMAFMAIASAADVLARSIATNKDSAAATAVAAKVAELAKAAEDKKSADSAAEAAAAEQAKAEELAREYRDIENLIPFDKPFSATFTKKGSNKPVDITVIAAAGGGTSYFLVMEDKKLYWMKTDQVNISGLAV